MSTVLKPRMKVHNPSHITPKKTNGRGSNLDDKLATIGAKNTAKIPIFAVASPEIVAVYPI